jgi:hypothetical protein
VFEHGFVIGQPNKRRAKLEKKTWRSWGNQALGSAEETDKGKASDESGGEILPVEVMRALVVEAGQILGMSTHGGGNSVALRQGLGYASPLRLPRDKVTMRLGRQFRCLQSLEFAILSIS